jgi:hypothetical protein
LHRTYRWLDAPPRLFGLSFRQWLVLVFAVGAGYGLVRALHIPAKVAMSGGVFVIGLPATLAYLSESDGMPVGRLLLDAVLWFGACRTFAPGGGGSSPSPRRLPVVRVHADTDARVPIEDAHREDGLLERLIDDGRWGS